jgi:two-component system sensor histidine kinase KdpD
VAGLAMAIAGPGLVTALASLPARPREAVPALLYLLAVLGAAAVGHLWPALLAAALSFIGLDYFFTPPVHAFSVAKADDWFALGVFVVVAAAVSAAISAALAQRARAESREHQVRALYHVTTRLLSGAGLDVVLQDLAASLQSLYDLRGCRIAVMDTEGRETGRVQAGSLDGEVVSVPLKAGRRLVGRIDMAGGPGGVSGPEGEVLNTFAGQLALALERARLGEEAAEARVEAEASRTRAALFSSVTHDLRTPLSSIMASATSLLEEGVPFSDEQRGELLRTIQEESTRLNRLVANLMDLSRLRAGALNPSREPLPVDELVASVIHRLRPQLARRPVRVTIRDDVPPVPADVVQVDQVLTNLLENAVRYSPPGSQIDISAARWRDTVELRVADRGPGIPPDDRARVFEEFYRRDVDGRTGGSGLGLAIAHAIVKAHGGAMWIEETPGGGTTVGLRLPVERGITPAEAGR